MYRLRAFISSLLAVAMLLTLISPGFGWEASAPADMAARAGIDEAGGPCELGAGEHDAHHHDHHGCAGHQFSHTPMQITASLDWMPETVRSRAHGHADAGFRSFIPSGLFRPPSTALA